MYASAFRNPVVAELLYVWTGDDDHKDADFLAVFEFNRSSPDYGKLLKTVPVTQPGVPGLLGLGSLFSSPSKGNEVRFFSCPVLSNFRPVKVTLETL